MLATFMNEHCAERAVIGVCIISLSLALPYNILEMVCMISTPFMRGSSSATYFRSRSAATLAHSRLPVTPARPWFAAKSDHSGCTTRCAQFGSESNLSRSGSAAFLFAIGPQPLSPARDLQLPLPTREPTSAALGLQPCLFTWGLFLPAFRGLLHSVFSVILGLSRLVFLSLSALRGLHLPHLPPLPDSGLRPALPNLGLQPVCTTRCRKLFLAYDNVTPA
ncbi:hypothetical protein P692DRAFT_20833879, partial [Suillus brevipes Sb2]